MENSDRDESKQKILEAVIDRIGDGLKAHLEFITDDFSDSIGIVRLLECNITISARGDGTIVLDIQHPTVPALRSTDVVGVVDVDGLREVDENRDPLFIIG
jgi:hypothetical protein